MANIHQQTREALPRTSLILKLSGGNYCYRYYHALRDIDLQLEKGRHLAILGANGAGKTTLFQILAGIRQLDGGQLRWFIDPGQVLFFPHQGPSNPSLTVGENLSWSKRHALIEGLAIGNEESKAMLKSLALDNLGPQRAAQLSNGERRKLDLAMVLLRRSQVLLLDEPTSGLDPAQASQLRHWLQDYCYRNGITLVVTSHILKDALALAKQIFFLKKGRLFWQGEMQALLRPEGRMWLSAWVLHGQLHLDKMASQPSLQRTIRFISSLQVDIRLSLGRVLIKPQESQRKMPSITAGGRQWIHWLANHCSDGSLWLNKQGYCVLHWQPLAGVNHFGLLYEISQIEWFRIDNYTRDQGQIFFGEKKTISNAREKNNIPGLEKIIRNSDIEEKSENLLEKIYPLEHQHENQIERQIEALYL